MRQANPSLAKPDRREERRRRQRRGGRVRRRAARRRSRPPLAERGGPAGRSSRHPRPPPPPDPALSRAPPPHRPPPPPPPRRWWWWWLLPTPPRPPYRLRGQESPPRVRGARKRQVDDVHTWGAEPKLFPHLPGRRCRVPVQRVVREDVGQARAADASGRRLGRARRQPHAKAAEGAPRRGATIPWRTMPPTMAAHVAPSPRSSRRQQR